MNIKINLEGMGTVLRNLENEIQAIQQRSVKGLVLCQIRLQKAAFNVTPWRLGHLAGSYQTPPPTQVRPGVWEAIVENTAEYALKVHEMPEDTNWNKPGTGPKFLERPLFENADKFLEILRRATAV